MNYVRTRCALRSQRQSRDSITQWIDSENLLQVSGDGVTGAGAPMRNSREKLREKSAGEIRGSMSRALAHDLMPASSSTS